MAKGQVRSSREAKKPKQDKPKQEAGYKATSSLGAKPAAKPPAAKR